jgi:hypothetical protein
MKSAKWTWTANGHLVKAADASIQRKLPPGRSPSLNSGALGQATALPEEPLEIPDMPNDLMIKTKHAAAILEVSAEAMKKRRQRGIGPPFVRLESGAIRYRLSVIKQYINDCTVKPSSKGRGRKGRP